MENLEQQKV